MSEVKHRRTPWPGRAPACWTMPKGKAHARGVSRLGRRIDASARLVADEGKVERHAQLTFHVHNGDSAADTGVDRKDEGAHGRDYQRLQRGGVWRGGPRHERG